MHFEGSLCPPLGKHIERGKTGRRMAHREETAVLVQGRDSEARAGVVAMGMEKKGELSEPFTVYPFTIW